MFYYCDKLKGSKIVEHIAHESLHAVNAIFDELGVEYGLTHDEHAAYMVGRIAKCCWNVLQKEIYKDKLLCLQRLTHRDKSDAALRRLRASGRMANHRGVFHSLQGKSWYDNNWIVYL